MAEPNFWAVYNDNHTAVVIIAAVDESTALEQASILFRKEEQDRYARAIEYYRKHDMPIPTFNGQPLVKILSEAWTELEAERISLPYMMALD